ncbi:MAG: FAD-dependent oxidoreductase [Armatimonadaceae bacterium]
MTVHGPEVETRCDAAVVCAGPWVTRWWPEFHDRFSVTRQTWAYVGDDQTPGPRTAWIDAESLAYGFPRDGVVEGFKIARHVPGTKTSPEGVDRNWYESDRLDLGGIANDRLPDLGPLHSPGTCLYTNTPDGLFAIGMGYDPGVYVVSPCSGHGFKFGPLIGEWAADAVESGSWPAESAPFSIERFAG